jgi:hypothetical protein
LALFVTIPVSRKVEEAIIIVNVGGLDVYNTLAALTPDRMKVCGRRARAHGRNTVSSR